MITCIVNVTLAVIIQHKPLYQHTGIWKQRNDLITLAGFLIERE